MAQYLHARGLFRAQAWFCMIKMWNNIHSRQTPTDIFICLTWQRNLRAGSSEVRCKSKVVSIDKDHCRATTLSSGLSQALSSIKRKHNDASWKRSMPVGAFNMLCPVHITHSTHANKAQQPPLPNIPHRLYHPLSKLPAVSLSTLGRWWQKIRWMCYKDQFVHEISAP